MKTILLITATLLVSLIVKAQCPSAGVDANACGQTVNLQSDGISGYWSGPTGAIYTPSDTVPSVSVWIPAYTGVSYTTTFTWNENGCTPADQVNITFWNYPNSEAGISQTVCGFTAQLAADTTGNSMYSTYWTCNVPGLLINPPTAWNSTADASGLGSGFWTNGQREVWFYWVVSNGLCTISIDSVLVTFYQVPEANAGPDQTICGYSCTLNATPSFGIGTWSQISGPAVAVFTDPSYPNTFVSVNVGNTNTFEWTETNGICTDKDTVTIQFFQIPTSTFIVESPTCINTPTSVMYTGNAEPGAIFSWNFDGATILSGTGAGPYEVMWSTLGTYTLSLQITSSNGCSSNISTQNVVVLPFKSNCCIIPTPNAGPDETVCGDFCTMQALAPATGNIITWTQISGPGTAEFTNSGLYNTTVVVPVYGTYSFKITEVNGMCDSSDVVNITFLQAPHSEGGLFQYVCGTSAELVADTIGSGIVSAYWTSNLPGVTITQIGTETVPFHISVDASLVPNLWVNSQREVWFYWNALSANACYSMDSVQVIFYEIPVASAGPDTSACGKITDMEGLWSIDNSTGIWTPYVLNVGSANFDPANQPNGQVTVTQYGIYSFIWKEMNAGNTTCFDRDTVVIEFQTVPAPDAGLDFSVCGKFAYICATPNVAGGQWSCPSGGVAYYDAENGNITPANQNVPCTWIRYSSENDTVTMYWSEFNGVCYAYDSVNIYFSSIQPAIALVNPADSVVCGPVYNLLNAQQPAYGNGLWIDTVANTVFSPSYAIPDPTVTIDNYYGYHSFYWITVNGDCRDTSEAVRVNFKTNKIAGIAQSSLVTDFSTFKAELFPEISYENIPYSHENLTSNGNFSLWAEPNQNYYLKIYSTNPGLYPTLANTYYNGSYSWENATLLTATGNCDTITVNVPLVTMTPATGGNCRIYGLVRYDVSLAPVPNVMVYIRYQPNQDPARFEYTNSNGYYSINNIATGNYKLFVDIPGLPQVTNHHIVVNTNDTVFANVNFIVDTTAIHKDYGFGIYADTTGYNIHVALTDFASDNINAFPNPFTEYISVSGTLKYQENISVELIDNSGQIIKNYPYNYFTPGEFNFRLPVPELAKGVYYLKITVDNTVYIKKLTRL